MRQVEQNVGEEEGLGWCLRDVQTQEWWCLTEVMDEGTIKAINERGRRWKVEPLVFVRTNGGKRGHAGKMEAARFAKASVNSRGHWGVPRNEKNSGDAQRLELVMVPVRTQNNDIVTKNQQNQTQQVVDAIVVEKYTPFKKRSNMCNNNDELRLNESVMRAIVLC